jgi:hypothetical protein
VDEPATKPDAHRRGAKAASRCRHGEQAAITFSGLLFGTQPTRFSAAAAYFLPPPQQRFVTDIDPRFA